MDKKDIFSNHTSEDFLQIALETFRYQAINCAVYKRYIETLSINPREITSLEKIPFLPIDFFKNHKIIVEGKQEEKVFSSSGTTGSIPSLHYIMDLSIYEESFRKAFEIFYGDPKQFAILALLPSYLERSGSSLIYMVDDLIKQSTYSESNYFLYNHEDLFKQLKSLKERNIPTILFGVTYALLDFIEKYPMNFPELIVMETGGMKGQRKEMIRKELHEMLYRGFGVSNIHSEYGMTELLSQAYSKGDGKFACPTWMKIMIRELNDPFSFLDINQTGGINVIDLANINSCSFIATQDLGKKLTGNVFEVLGRFDQSDIRGCNLLIGN
jgi:phenylacetate-coenzyme A ligase PaaK-like adenylate-forming protein